MVTENDFCNERCNIVQLLESDHPVNMCAPMVRYSKQAFRLLIRKYNCDIAYTPMIISNSYVQSQLCRDNEFTPHPEDRPLIAQFAASNSKDFAEASEIIYDHVDGVDLNCGCPQRWSMAEGYGAKLIQKPELIEDIVKTTRNRLPSLADFSVSIKIRIHDDITRTIDMCRQIEACGVSFIAIHGRTTKERNQPVHYDAIKLIKDSLSIPVVANGGIKKPEDCERVFNETGVNGVMVAQGILNNPTIFANYNHTPVECIQEWVNLCQKYDVPFTRFHNHLVFMQKHLPKHEKQIFNNQKTKEEDISYLENYYNISFNESVRV